MASPHRFSGFTLTQDPYVSECLREQKGVREIPEVEPQEVIEIFPSAVQTPRIGGVAPSVAFCFARAIFDEDRVRILKSLTHSEPCFCQIIELLKLSRSNGFGGSKIRHWTQ
jgi:hypothetical protein